MYTKPKLRQKEWETKCSNREKKGKCEQKTGTMQGMSVGKEQRNVKGEAKKGNKR